MLFVNKNTFCDKFIMRRGPKPIDFDLLVSRAELCGVVLHRLRDGSPGLLRHLKGGVWQTIYLAELRWDEVGRPDRVSQRIKDGQMSYRPIRCRVTTLAVPPTKKALRDVLRIAKRCKYWDFTPPDFPKPQLWKGLNEARSVHDLREVTRRLRRISPEFASFLSSHAEGILRAKHLPNYPKSNRPRSDDKRIQFFAKVLAGLELGIAPATALKRLARLPFPHDPRRILPHYTVIFEKEGREGGRK